MQKRIAHLPNGDLDFTMARLGECRFPSPLSGVRFIRDDERVLYHTRFEDMKAWIAKGAYPPAMEAAGPREKPFFDSSQLACGIVTCGGLCPGLDASAQPSSRRSAGKPGQSLL